MRQKLLIVDDEQGIVEMMKSYFERQYDVLTAYNGREAMVRAAQKPDLILLDINMPGMDGLEVLRRIKSGQPGLKVVMLSALSQESNVRQALQYGADAFVVKPFQPECLLERIG